MAAEDNKEVKEKGDGKAVKGVDEKELHGRTGCMRENNVRLDLHAFTLCAVHSHRCQRCIPFRSHGSRRRNDDMESCQLTSVSIRQQVILHGHVKTVSHDWSQRYVI